MRVLAATLFLLVLPILGSSQEASQGLREEFSWLTTMEDYLIDAGWAER